MTALWARRQAGARRLTPADAPALAALLDQQPVIACVFASRLADGDARLWSTPVWGVPDPHGGQRLAAACWVGANVYPVATTAASVPQLAAAIGARPRHASAIVGEHRLVEELWPLLRQRWGPVRELRSPQPLLAIRSSPPGRRDAELRRVLPADLPEYRRAAAAMLAEELGMSAPALLADPGFLTHCGNLVAAGRAWGHFDAAGRVVFKAEIAAANPRAAQIQGIWVEPERRRRGFASAALATVVDHALAGSTVVSLYVNDYNQPARGLYRKVGFTEVGALTTILL